MADLALLEDVVGADLVLWEDVVGADLALLEDVMQADLVLFEDVVGATGYIRRSERVFGQHTNLLAVSKSSKVFGYWHVSARVRRYSRSFPALTKLFNAWRQSLPVSSLYTHSIFNLFPYTAVCCVWVKFGGKKNLDYNWKF